MKLKLLQFSTNVLFALVMVVFWGHLVRAESKYHGFQSAGVSGDRSNGDPQPGRSHAVSDAALSALRRVHADAAAEAFDGVCARRSRFRFDDLCPRSHTWC